MTPNAETPFADFLTARLAAGGFSTDDALACVLPLFRQTLRAHQQGSVAPLDGIERIVVVENAAAFRAELVSAARFAPDALARIDRPSSRALDIVGQERRVTDVDVGAAAAASLLIGASGEEPTRPVYLAGYRSWEHAVGHHDPVTDVFSLGLLLASVACGLDLSGPETLEKLVVHRGNLFVLRASLNPVVAKTIVRMTELSRRKRAKDLGALLRRLERYREQDDDPDLVIERIQGFQRMELQGKRAAVLARLRDRLFEISRRNRLLYFRPSLQSLNLTFASVPLTFDVGTIRPEQLFTWRGEVEAQISAGKPIQLGKYLRFEDAPYISEVLDKIISDARRDRAEYGFAQLRLVLCFLRWHNLKEAPEERIDSPLLLLPVKLSKKKGVRDSYILEPDGTVAEVNPVLRHHLRVLYGVDLPTAIDLAETKVEALHDFLASRIQASEPGVTVNKVDQPKVDIIYDRARKRLDQYQRRLRLTGGGVRSFGEIDYSYDRDNFQPLGLRLFEIKVRPAPAPIRDFVEAPRPQWTHAVDPAPSSEKERRVAAFRDGGPVNPYSWDFDLCALTLGNFRYRKMSLVRDYESLLENDVASPPFDAVFTLVPRPPTPGMPPPAPLEEQFHVIPCDPTQASAIGLARTGKSFIIQGPPGTGKSQTITNLIADFVARGKHVLFVCEKRAALDVVYHRLKQHGLDALSTLVHDSQTDKKELILDLKRTYEAFLKESDAKEADPEASRVGCVKGMARELEPIRRYDELLKSSPPGAGLPLCRLLHRRVEVERLVPPLSAVERERVPRYGLWDENRETLERIVAAMRDLEESGVFSRHPLRLLHPEIASNDRPIEAALQGIEATRAALDALEKALRATGLPQTQWDEYHEAVELVGYAVRVRPLVERGLLSLLERGSEASRALANGLAEQAKRRQASLDAAAAARGWKQKLSQADALAALAQARGFEGSWLSPLRPDWWRLRRILRARYDFAGHVVRPSWAQALEMLEREYAAVEEQAIGEAKLRETYGGSGDSEAFARTLEETRAFTTGLRGPAQALHARAIAEPEAASRAILALAAVEESLGRLRAELGAFLCDYEELTLPLLRAELERIESSIDDLPAFLSVLSDVARLPPPLATILRRSPQPPEVIEASMAERSVQEILHSDRFLTGFGGPLRERHLSRLDAHYERWLEANAASVIDRVRRELRRKVQISSLPVGALTMEQRQLKQDYSTGRRELEHELSKTMRYKSIRELLGKKSGDVILDLKPVWLMSPLSISDTLPMDVQRFDVVIFDEASQIPVENAIPSIFRGPQIIVVGDEMQLPPTSFFSAKRVDEQDLAVEEQEENGAADEYDLDSTSFLHHASKNLPATRLGWHYRSRSEALISFSNAAFYEGSLLTVPDRRFAGAEAGEIFANEPAEAEANIEGLLARSLSFHFLRKSPYENRRNPGEAAYIAHQVRALLKKKTGLTIGIIAFSEAQQDEIERALHHLAKSDAEFHALLEAEYEREEDGQFVGLLVKNLENIQGDERDLVILSICYGPARDGRMIMNFGPINQSGGEKRLNVAFSRAKRHMAVVSSIKSGDIKNIYNDGANCLRSYLEYAESTSRGDSNGAKRILAAARPGEAEVADAPRVEAAVEQIAGALRERGYEVEIGVGHSRFRCDLAVRAPGEPFYRAAIDVDTPAYYDQPDLFERELLKPRVLRAFDWRVCHVLTKDWIRDRQAVLDRVEKLLAGGAQEENDAWEQAAAEEGEAEIAKPDTVAPAAVSPNASAKETPPDNGTPADAQGTRARRFELVGGGSSKFWEVSSRGAEVTVRFGKIGAQGQTQSKAYPDAAAASREAEKLVRQKLAKGYKETSPERKPDA